MMRFYFLWSFFLLCLGCSAASNTINQERNLSDKSVSVTAQAVEVVANTPYMDTAAIDRLGEGMVDSLSNRILAQMITGFQLDRKDGVTYTPNHKKALYYLSVDTIWVNRGRFTLDFTHPGPIFSITMKIQGFQDTRPVFRQKYKTRVNFAQVVGKNKAFYWPDSRAKENVGNQIMTTMKGIRHLLGEGFAEFLDIEQYQ